ncbi:hypothetical protein GCM10023149_07720 [Mucilaginibacter gynuensis]|uniref:DUF4270 family protein n=1 Tax=Mucilaginibacter gynuensis TaxID=1302236 RepID=A0ABP8FWQ5_9SPHI
MKLHKSLFFLLLLAVAGCKKYDIAPLVKDPAYIRVFNDLSNDIDVFHSAQVAPFLTFLMDPKTDGDVPNDAEIIGDYMGIRQLYSLSYPVNEANSSIGTGTLNSGQPGSAPVINLYPLNYEYPGNAHVLTAPVMNGFDLSAWAQISSGKHRIMFVVRPQNNIPFKELASTIRSRVLLDTTVNFEKGEVYTLEVVSRDLDNGKYGLYIRHEQFVHQAFDENKLYIGFVNLSGKKPLDNQQGFGNYIGDNVRISTTYNLFNDAVYATQADVVYDAYPEYKDTYMTTLNTKMDTGISFQPLPLLPESAFFYQGILRSYYAFSNNNVFFGTLPYYSFNLLDADKPVTDPDSRLGYLLRCHRDPSSYNNYSSRDNNRSAPNLNLLVNSGNGYHVYSTVNIMEIVYDRVYTMQLQRGFNNVPKN